MKKNFLIFVVALVLNVVWENLHSVLYVEYKGGAITEFILFRASIVDAVIITLMSLPFLWIPRLQRKSWFIIVLGVLIAIGIEWWALDTGRWAYTASMPIIPILETGLTPTIQLGLLGYLSYWFVARVLNTP